MSRSSPSAQPLSRVAARRFLLRAFQLERPQPLPDVASALQALEYVQMDSINVCGRVHDLILWSRVRRYRPELLDRLLYSRPCGAFEYDFPNLSVLPVADYPYFVRTMRARGAAGHRTALTPAERRLADELLGRIAADGPLRTRAGARDDRRTLSAWGIPRSLATHVLDKLWLQGRLAIARRENFERWFDLPDRMLPPELAALQDPAAKLPSREAEVRYRTRKRLRARRLFRPSRQDLRALGAEAFTEVALEGSTRPWYVLAEDRSALAAASDARRLRRGRVNFLAPLDPLVYDRERARVVFDFDYTWEVYTPRAKRRWGYYVLPVLWGDRLVARLDPKLDRRSATLQLQSLRLEPGVDAEAFAPQLAKRLHDFAGFLGAKEIRLDAVEPDRLRTLLRAAGI